MPAYNYFPANYQPFPQTYYQPQVPQQMQQTQQQNSFQNLQSGMLWVGSEQEALSYPVAPNNAVALWDSVKPVVYIKQADASGKPVLKAYDLTEKGLNATTSARSEESGKATAYATKSEMEAVSREIEAVKEDLKQIMAKVAKARKREVIEDDE